MICAHVTCNEVIPKDEHLCCADHWNVLPPNVRKEFYRLRQKAQMHGEGAQSAYYGYVEHIKSLLEDVK